MSCKTKFQKFSISSSFFYHISRWLGSMKIDIFEILFCNSETTCVIENDIENIVVKKLNNY